MNCISPLVSIIVPVYNAQRYLDSCISSIVKQSYQKLEIILVDDGSSDSSPNICDKWRDRDSRINVIRQINQGSSHARNVGLNFAHGDWILFVDSDDLIYENAVEVLIYNSIGVDIVSFGWKTISEDGKDLSLVLPKATKNGNEEQLLFEITVGSLENYFWSYFFRREKLYNAFLNNYSIFDESFSLFEDAVSLQRLLRSNHFKVRFLHSCLYLYRQVKGSLSRRGSGSLAIDGVRAISELESMSTSPKYISFWNRNLIRMCFYCDKLFVADSSHSRRAFKRTVLLHISKLYYNGGYKSLHVLDYLKILCVIFDLYGLARMLGYFF